MTRGLGLWTGARRGLFRGLLFCVYPTVVNCSKNSHVNTRAGHRPGSSPRCRFFLALSSALCALRRSSLAAALPPLAICRQRVNWYNLLKRPLLTHLRETAQCDNIASKFGGPRGSDQPSNSRHHPKRQNLHPHWFQRHSRV